MGLPGVRGMPGYEGLKVKQLHVAFDGSRPTIVSLRAAVYEQIKLGKRCLLTYTTVYIAAQGGLPLLRWTIDRS